MPIHIKHNAKSKLLYGKIVGQTNIEELGQALEKVTTSEEFPLNVNALWDLYNLDFSQLNANLGETLTSTREKFEPGY